MLLPVVLIRKKIGLARNWASGFVPHRDGAGFTLIELVITIGVFSIGVLAAFSLAIGNSNDNRANKDRIIAANLAREALELVRNIRDSDWLRTDSNLDAGGEIYYLDNSVLANNNFLLLDYKNFSGGQDVSFGLNNCKTDNSCRLYIDSDGFYSHEITGSITNFFRVVSLKRVCLNDFDNPADPVEYIDSVCGDNHRTVGVEVTASVAWDRAGKENKLELSDRFYNWR